MIPHESRKPHLGRGRVRVRVRVRVRIRVGAREHEALYLGRVAKGPSAVAHAAIYRRPVGCPWARRYLRPVSRPVSCPSAVV